MLTLLKVTRDDVLTIVLQVFYPTANLKGSGVCGM